MQRKLLSSGETRTLSPGSDEDRKLNQVTEGNENG